MTPVALRYFGPFSEMVVPSIYLSDKLSRSLTDLYSEIFFGHCAGDMKRVNLYFISSWLTPAECVGQRALASFSKFFFSTLRFLFGHQDRWLRAEGDHLPLRFTLSPGPGCYGTEFLLTSPAYCWNGNFLSRSSVLICVASILPICSAQETFSHPSHADFVRFTSSFSEPYLVMLNNFSFTCLTSANATSDTLFVNVVDQNGFVSLTDNFNHSAYVVVVYTF